MRLLHFNESGKLALTDFAGKTIPPYAILSHRWWEDCKEVHYQEVLNGSYASKDGYRKIEFCANQATQDQLHYFWIDTCCFDRYDSRERSDAVNSMFRWYQNATKCYVFLSDISIRKARDAQRQSTWEARFRASEWFNRAWTLQELIAPESVEFFCSEGHRLGDKISLMPVIHEITSIPLEVLQGCALETFSVSDRMTWARSRKATEPEDHAYCLLGILNVQIPLTYGEGKDKALSRLEDEVRNADTPCIIPFSRNDRFVGRQSHLAEVEAILSAGNRTTRIAITGEGGTGKSQLALEIAYRIKKKDKACSVFWIDASHINSVYQAYASIAQKLKVPGWENEDADAMQLVKLHLSGDYAMHWLLIFDNVDSLAFEDAGPFTPQSSSLINHLPQSELGSVIFTTTNSDVAQSLALQNIVELHEMAPDTAHEMFENYLSVPVPMNEKQEMKLLLETLAHLPLAIAHAAAYINQNKITIENYLSLLATQNVDALQGSSDLSDDKLRNSIMPGPVIKTLLVSLDQIRRNHSLAADFLFLMACIDRKDILLDILKQTWSQEREDAIRTLSDYKLVTRRPAVSALDLHRLVYLAIRRWIETNSSLDEWMQKAIRHLEEVFPSHHHGNISKWRRLLPHAKCALSHSPVNLDNEKRMRLAWKCARSLYEDGRNNEAEELLVQMMEICKKKFGTDDPNTLEIMNILASTYRRQSRWEAAEELNIHVLEIRKKKLGIDHPDTLTSMTNLASTYHTQGRWKAAEELNMHALLIRNNKLGADHPDTLISTTYLAATFWNQGRWEAAEELEVQVLEIRKKTLGIDHPDTLTSMNSLAQMWKNQGRDRDAIRLMDECISSRTRVLGHVHPRTVNSTKILAKWRARAEQLDIL